MKFLASKREDGQGLVEYAMILVFVAVVVIGALTLLGPQLGNIYSTITTCVPPTPACS
ncbi:MAG: hypothetical protein AAF490_18350 [Chloroflexota bacterium]